LPEDLKIVSIMEVLQGYLNTALQHLPTIGSAIALLLVVFIISKFTKRFGTRLSEKLTDDLSLQSLFQTTIQVIVWSIGLFAAAAIVFPGLKAGDLVGVLGLSSVAIGFAFKDIFQNFLAGVLILTQRPFSIGDQIARGDIEGTVESISIRSTTIRTYDGQRVIVPNAELYTNPVTVRTAQTTRRTTFSTGIGYGEDIEKARTVITDALAECDLVKETPAPQIYVSNHGASSIDFDVRYWTDSDKATTVRALDQVATAIKYALDNADIEIPYTYRTLEFFDKTDYAELLSNLSPAQLEALRNMPGRVPSGGSSLDD
jgi:small-conductance mechanosensitive channel